ncbi:hypothetical protein BAE44_0015707 [Dichanthelium oligosanthes]|uniref:Uncharacterized protein n=1 Tax=Dichanthelium oligosanthes TaxID=888268 RepID=A0A1E5VDQ3_9POAL|nr:hypothetical protein BAE44_0015707 [Dichanthelium oligosanthes]
MELGIVGKTCNWRLLNKDLCCQKHDMGAKHRSRDGIAEPEDLRSLHPLCSTTP